jgi:hypothetical protein
MLDALAAPGHISFIIDGEVFDTVEEGGGHGATWSGRRDTAMCRAYPTRGYE